MSGADSMAYDAENRQKSYTPSGGATTNYYYDEDGRRVKKVDTGGTTIFVYEVSGHLITEYINLLVKGTRDRS
jgi:YD repeat-containing protein